MSGPINKILLVGAAYGIIQVLMQDIGVKTGIKQRDLMQTPAAQLFLSFSAAYTITEDLFLAGIATGIYFYLRDYYSDGKVSTVCFEEV